MSTLVLGAEGSSLNPIQASENIVILETNVCTSSVVKIEWRQHPVVVGVFVGPCPFFGSVFAFVGLLSDDETQICLGDLRIVGGVVLL